VVDLVDEHLHVFGRDRVGIYERLSNQLTEGIERYLSRLNVTSTYWPGDQEVREALREGAGIPSL
jgi:hypothetical protein